ncbi:hypothetical protein BC937DRAFT_89863 [Endogone sp. FLAS-F59071]|nr:hypothetical protein BC937DRAFT_89863 [Endogone sp. FLAS-F59071]|eukprot:RUS22260.1 hypothetical protein BC937DRAFT_89863 [Endogone sp. FLAS-F59071]
MPRARETNRLDELYHDGVALGRTLFKSRKDQATEGLPKGTQPHKPINSFFSYSDFTIFARNTLNVVLNCRQYHIPAIVQHVGDGIGLLSEFRDFVKERAQIEKDYADKLEKLTKRYAVKKDKKKGVEKQDRMGDDDDEWNWEDTESTTFKAWVTLLSETEAIARSRAHFSEKLTTQVSDNLKIIAAKKEEARKKHIAFYQKLKADRDKSYNDKDSAKKAYDDSCEELETLRAKIDRTGDYPEKVGSMFSDIARVASFVSVGFHSVFHRHHETDFMLYHYSYILICCNVPMYIQLKKQEEQILINRNNNKNIYLLAVGVANAHKQKFYDEDIPALADVRTNSIHTFHLQNLNASRILVLRDIMNSYVELDASCLRETQTHLKILSGTVQAMDPDTDANNFIRQCVASAAAIDIASRGESLARTQFVFKPWNGGDRASATVVDRVGVEGWAGRERLLAGIGLCFGKDVDLVSEDSAVVYLNNILVKDRKKLAEISADLDKRGREADSFAVQKQKLEGMNDPQGVHDVTEPPVSKPAGTISSKPRSQSRRRAITAKCGYNCHAKCEMKVPPDCARVKGKIARKPSMAVQPQSTSAVPPPPSVSPVGTIRSNRSITSAPSSSSASLQPPIYNAASKPRSPTSPAVPKPAKVKQMTATALYDYDAETDEELPLKEGDVLTVIQADAYVSSREVAYLFMHASPYALPVRADGSGWIKARKNFREGLVPANYIQVHTPSAGTTPASPRSQKTSYFDETPAQEYVRVLYDFKGQSPEELSLRTGDVITLTSRGEDGWWEGTLNGRSGIFPENYVEKM